MGKLMYSPMDHSAINPSRQDRLYVLAQCVGWGSFTIAYLGLAQLNKHSQLGELSLFVASNLIGLLLSHLYRTWIHRRGWKQLNWGALLPRVIAATLILALLWTLCSWPLYTILGAEEQPRTVSTVALFVFSVFNGIWLFTLWSLFYFGYQFGNRYRRSELERAQLTVTVKEAELRALKSQVNPHFIFNALNSMRALIGEDPTRARESVTQLANLLRYSLQSGQLETVPLDEELQIVNDYLALEQVRHEERLRVRLEIDPQTLHLPIPPMLLQTLVENAVKYGISTLAEGGEIMIVTRASETGFVLQVTNPGRISSRAEKPILGVNSTGVGLKNAAQRLRLLFGEAAILELREDTPGTVIAEAIIPRTTLKTSTVTPA